MTMKGDLLQLRGISISAGMAFRRQSGGDCLTSHTLALGSGACSPLFASHHLCDLEQVASFSKPSFPDRGMRIKVPASKVDVSVKSASVNEDETFH